MTRSATSCAVCGNPTPGIFELRGRKRTSCAVCQHSQRIDFEHFEYAAFAMGRTANSQTRIEEQAKAIAPLLVTRGIVLEMGCAGGELAAALRGAGSLARYDGIEISPAVSEAHHALDVIHERPLEQLLDAGLVEPASYDLAIASHVLEHIEDIASTVAAIVRVLKPSGAAFVEVPNRSGHPLLPFDDNASHIHFFSTSSLVRLLTDHSLEVVTAHTGARHDARYPDSIRVVARPFQPPSPSRPLSDALRRLGVGAVIVWGAGRMADEMLAHYLNPEHITFFVDANPAMHGKTIMTRPVREPQHLRESAPSTILINSLEYEYEIRRRIETEFGDTPHQVIAIATLLDQLSKT